jgi:HK97 family phage major capsid protein/HK97 family phage prohead protease
MDKKPKLAPGKAKLGPHKRYARLLSDAGGATEVPVGVVDRESRTVTFSFSSETPCPFWDGQEVLSHHAGAARMQRINAGGPLLFNHDMNDLLGVVEKAWIGTDHRGYCTVRFGSDERGEWAMNQVDDRILQNVSFWYRVYSYQSDMDTDTYTALDWEPYEISLVTVPADASVGVGRSAAGDEYDVAIHEKQTNPATADITEEEEMIKRKQRKLDVLEGQRTAGAPAAPAPAPAPGADPAAVEHARVNEIEAMCRSHQIGDETRTLMVTLRTPIEQARGIVLNEVLARGRGVASLGSSTNPDMTEREKAKYSMLRAINAAVKERLGESNPWKDAGFEREISQAIGQRSGKMTAGIYVPTNLQFAARNADYSVGTGAGLSGSSGGSNLVATNLMAGSMIELLRNKARVFGLGAQMLSGLVGNIDIPRQKAAGQSYWVGEGGTLSQTGAQFDKVSLSPKHIGALSLITRNMLQQSTPDVDMLARADLLSTLALGIDLAALSGTGASNQPLGIANQAGINQIIGGVNGAAITIDHLIDMETGVADSNADSDSMAYLANARTVGALKKLKSANGEYLWSNSPMGQRSGTPGEINGYTVARTNQVRKNLTKGTGTNLSEVFFGDWSQVLVGEWGVVEILPNPYAAGLYEAGGIELRVLQTLDIAVRHPQAFSVMSDAITN